MSGGRRVRWRSGHVSWYAKAEKLVKKHEIDAIITKGLVKEIR